MFSKMLSHKYGWCRGLPTFRKKMVFKEEGECFLVAYLTTTTPLPINS